MGSGGERSCVSVLVCFGGRCDIPACGNDGIFGQILVCLAIQIDGMYWSSTAGLMMGLVDCQMLLECRLLVVWAEDLSECCAYCPSYEEKTMEPQP